MGTSNLITSNQTLWATKSLQIRYTITLLKNIREKNVEKEHCKDNKWRKIWQTRRKLISTVCPQQKLSKTKRNETKKVCSNLKYMHLHIPFKTHRGVFNLEHMKNTSLLRCVITYLQYIFSEQMPIPSASC